MGIRLDLTQVAPFEELLMSQVVQQEALTRVTYQERDIQQGGVFRNGEGGKPGNEEKSEMRTQRIYLRLTLDISVLLGIILPLVLGVKDLTVIAITFISVLFTGRLAECPAL